MAQDLAALTKYSPFLLAPGGHRTPRRKKSTKRGRHRAARCPCIVLHARACVGPVRTHGPSGSLSSLFLLWSQNSEIASPLSPLTSPLPQSFPGVSSGCFFHTSIQHHFFRYLPTGTLRGLVVADVLAAGISLESRAGCHAAHSPGGGGRGEGGPMGSSAGDWACRVPPGGPQAGAAQRRDTSPSILLLGAVWTLGSCACPQGSAPLFPAPLARRGSWGSSVLGSTPPRKT